MSVSFQTAGIDHHPTRNGLSTEKQLSLPTLSSLLQNSGTQSEPEPKHDTKPFVQGPQVIPGTLFDTPNNLIQSVFPNVAGLPPGEQKMEQLMTLLTRMDDLPHTQVGLSAFKGLAPANYAVRHDVGKDNPSMKSVLKASQLVENSGVARNKGIDTEKNRNKGVFRLGTRFDLT